MRKVLSESNLDPHDEIPSVESIPSGILGT